MSLCLLLSFSLCALHTAVFSFSHTYILHFFHIYLPLLCAFFNLYSVMRWFLSCCYSRADCFPIFPPVRLLAFSFSLCTKINFFSLRSFSQVPSWVSFFSFFVAYSLARFFLLVFRRNSFSYFLREMLSSQRRGEKRKRKTSIPCTHR